MVVPEFREELAHAAAAAGVLAGMSASAYRSAGAEPLVDALRASPTSWRPDLPHLAPGLSSTSELADRWLAAIRQAEGPVRLQFDGASDDRENEWLELVRTRAAGIDGTSFPIRQTWPRGPEWSIPPQVALARDLPPGAECQVLVTPGVPREGVRASFVLIDGAADERTGREIARAVHASGWASIRASQGFLVELRGRLNEAPLDVALRGTALAWGLPVPRLFYSPPALRWTDPRETDLPPWEPPPALVVPSFPLREQEEQEAEHPGYGMPDTGGGDDGRYLEHSDRGRPERYVQGKLLAPDADADAPGLERDEWTGRCDLALQIGPPRPGWTAVPEALPEQALERGIPHELRIVLTLPSLQDEPAAVTVTLPADGRSTVARFPLDLPPNFSWIEGRAVILHRGRVLQTVRVVIAPFASLYLLPETTPRPGFDDLEQRGEFGAAFIVNHTPAGMPGTTVIPHDGVPVYLPAGWDTAANALQQSLQLLVLNELEGGVAFTQAVYGLALQGDLLRREIDRDQRLSGQDLPPMQVVAARPDAWLPLELVYDGPIPEDDALAPTMCQHALERLRDDRPGICDGPHATNTVCLLGFWGLRTVIERQAFDPAAATGHWDWRLDPPTPGNARLDRPAAAVFAAHRKADVVSKTASSGVVEALDQLGFTDARVYKWADWCARVEDERPGLLVALAHTDWFAPSIPLLAIEDDRLKLNSIAAKHVSDGTGNPVVLLLGCSTANVAVPFQGVAAAFRTAGAPVVVATLANVYGRYAGPAAAAAIEQFANAAGEDVDVGTVMLRLRRRLMAQGLPIGLGLLAYGDAEWRLGLPTTP
jgi:hypothetical protein